MGGRLAGKSALITAAGQGIGRATAIAMAQEGAAVLATDIDGDALATLQGIAEHHHAPPRRAGRRRGRGDDRVPAAAADPVQLRRLRPPRIDPRDARPRTGSSAST